MRRGAVNPRIGEVQTSVYGRVYFPLLKNPKAVRPVYAKWDNRAEAIGYVLIPALLIYLIIEQWVRISLEEANEPMGDCGCSPDRSSDRLKST